MDIAHHNISPDVEMANEHNIFSIGPLLALDHDGTLGRRHPVAMKQANAWGLRDMHGNVAEWCRDFVGINNFEVAIRGGSWESDFSSRSAAKNSDTPFLRINRVGFRLVLVREESISAMPGSPAFDIS